MAIPEDIADLWSDFPLQPKIEPLDDLFDEEPKLKVGDNTFELPPSFVSYDVSETEDFVEFPSTELEQEFLPTFKIVGPDKSMVEGTFKASKLYAYEDFHSFLAREGGIDRDRLSRLVNHIIPKPEEDFVSFLARSNGIMDENIVDRLRQALKLENVIEYSPEIADGPVKMEDDQKLEVGDGEDAASFFVRAGSWESSSSISEELASVGLDEFVDEDAESFFRRTERLYDAGPRGLSRGGSMDYVSPSLATLVSSDQEASDFVDQASTEISGGSSDFDGTEANDTEEVPPKKRKTNEDE